MRLLIDLQGGQATNAERGIGRAASALTAAIARNPGGHDVHVLLNASFVEPAISLREQLADVVAPDHIHTIHTAAGADARSGSPFLADANALARETFIAELAPDAVLVTSVFEGFVDSATTTIHRHEHGIPVAAVLYDLIPHVHEGTYLADPAMRSWYRDRFADLSRADLLLAISEASRLDAEQHLPGVPVVTVPCATTADFGPRIVEPARERELRAGTGLRRPFLMYTGGIDPRKNIERLIEAFAALPASVRGSHQLAVVCAAEADARAALLAHAAEVGLVPGDVVLTGFVSDEDLRDLYALCAAFVFPSWYEGFGLPVLEAMTAGRAVIGSNVSSIPEIIGRDDALFDPFDVADISGRILQVLTDEDLRVDLERSGLERAALFNWDRSAALAIEALEAMTLRVEQPTQVIARPTMAYVSPVPPARSGVSDYSAELLPELAEHYRITVITDETSTDLALPVRSCAWLREHADEFDRVLYHFGNSEFHGHMFSLLADVPGAVVMHDFFLSGLVAHMDHGDDPGRWATELYRSHGYRVAQLRSNDVDGELVWRFPANLSPLQAAETVIVHSSHARALAAAWYGPHAADGWTVIPHLRHPMEVSPAARAAARARLGIAPDRFVVASFGMTGRTKLNHRLLAAFERSRVGTSPRGMLVFAGENQNDDYGAALLERVGRTGGRVRLTGRLDGPTFADYLLSADLAVQLRARSRGETSGAILDCFNGGVPVIANAHGATAELPSDALHLIGDAFSDSELRDAIDQLAADDDARRVLVANARRTIHEDRSPRHVAQLYADAIESGWGTTPTRRQLAKRLAGLPNGPTTDDELRAAAASTTATFAPRPRQPQLFVDISELVRLDAGTGIQRVTKNVLRELLLHPPSGVRVEPVYATATTPYRYARSFTASFLGIASSLGGDDVVEPCSGDTFLGLDLQPQVIPAHRSTYRTYRARGVQVQFVVYDLLPLLLPEHFAAGAAEGFRPWLEVVAESDGVVAISQSVADDVSRWVAANAPDQLDRLRITSFRLAAHHGVATAGFPADAPSVLASLAARPTFLMVGTLEPRKGHAVVLDAFESLWAADVDVNLVIVGKVGWMVDDLLSRLRGHAEAGQRLIVLEAITDEYLSSVYEFSSCLIAASFGEGFGLPLIEADFHNMPVIARDIPVFREVGGANTTYFSGGAADLSHAIRRWLHYGPHRRSAAVTSAPTTSWADSTRQLLAHLALPAPLT